MKYFVNDDPWPGQQHEVHKEGCSWMPTTKTYLGDFVNCQGAVAKAKTIYSDADGCKHCSLPCHNK
jgi:hypothetical protein